MSLRINLTYNGSSKILKRLCQAVNYLSQYANGDMLKSTYDANNNGIIDNAEKVNGHEVWKDVPADAKFTDTVYDDTYVKGRVKANSNNVELIMHTLFDWEESYLTDSEGHIIVDSDRIPIYTSSYQSKFDKVIEAINELQSRNYVYWGRSENNEQ